MEGHSQQEWGVEKKITVSVIVSVVTTIAAVAGVFSAFSARLDHVEQVAGLLTREQAAQQQVVIKVARIDERVAAMQEVLGEIKSELRGMRR